MIQSFDEAFFKENSTTNFDNRRESQDTSKFNGSAYKISSLTSCLTPNFHKYRKSMKNHPET